MRMRTPGPEHAAPAQELGALALTALALALLAVVGLASSASPWQPNEAAAGGSTTALQVLVGAGGAVLVVALLLLWLETPTARRAKMKRRTIAAEELDELGSSLWSAGKVAAVLLLGLAIFVVATVPFLSRDAPEPSQRGTGAAPSAPADSSVDEVVTPPDSIELGWLLLPIAVTFVILAPAAAVIRRRRLQRGKATEAEEASALGRAVRASIAALEAERDPRTAILRAYARMEQAFRDVEIVRARDETASEFLGRTTRRLPVSAGAAAALTERFEEVRFSTHEITETDREQALASLHRVERELTK
jgi:hypothetical protein